MFSLRHFVTFRPNRINLKKGGKIFNLALIDSSAFLGDGGELEAKRGHGRVGSEPCLSVVLSLRCSLIKMESTKVIFGSYSLRNCILLSGEYIDGPCRPRAHHRFCYPLSTLPASP